MKFDTEVAPDVESKKPPRPMTDEERFAKENGYLLFYAVSVRDYETLSLNMAELKRYIQQQNEIIIYYEEAVKPIKKEDANGKVQRKN